MKTTEARQRLAMNAEQLERVEKLLLRYPDVTPEESEEISHFLQKGHVMDLSLLSTNHDAWPKAEQFKRENPEGYAFRTRDYWIVGIILASLILALILLWDAGAGT